MRPEMPSTWPSRVKGKGTPAKGHPLPGILGKYRMIAKLSLILLPRHHVVSLTLQDNIQAPSLRSEDTRPSEKSR